MCIERVTTDDVLQLINIANLAVRKTVEATRNDKLEILEGISRNIKDWCSKDNCAFFKFSNNGDILGFVLIKEYWNFSDIFILPEFQRKGIGLSIARHAINTCKKMGTGEPIRVNSSKNATVFYLKLGFKEIDIGKSLPYEMVSYEYNF